MVDLQHTCKATCSFFTENLTHICKHNGAIHLCGSLHCDKAVSDRDGIVCVLTGRHLGQVKFFCNLLLLN